MYLDVAPAQSPEFNTLTDDIDMFVAELESEILKLYGAKGVVKQTNVGIWRNQETATSTQESQTAETSACYEVCESSAGSTNTRSTIYSDFDNDSYSLSAKSTTESKSTASELLESAISIEHAPARKDTLRPSEIALFCSNINNIRHIKLDIKNMLFGKVAPEMCPDYNQPALVLSCQLGSWKWYTSKNAQQIKAFDKVVRSWLSLEHLKLPRLPDLTLPSSPRTCHSNHRQMEEYIATLCAHLPRLNDHVLGAFSRFIASDPVVPSPIFDCSAYGYVKSTVGYKVRFCVFTNGALQIFDAPGGKLLSRVTLYLSSVQRSPDLRNTISLQELDTTSVNIKKQTIISFENDLVCDKWLEMLQGATHTKVPFSHTIAALPYTLISWKE